MAGLDLMREPQQRAAVDRVGRRLVAAALGDPPAGGDEADRHQEAGQDAGDEEVGDADAADQRVEDHRDRRRDQDVDDRRGGVVGGAEAGRVAALLLPGDQDRAERRGVGDGAARDAAEGDRGDDRGRELAAAPALHALGGEVQQLLPEPAAHHQGAGQHEEGQRQHREGLGLLEHGLRHGHDRDRARPEDGAGGGDDQRVPDRDREDHQHAEAENDDEAHGQISLYSMEKRASVPASSDADRLADGHERDQREAERHRPVAVAARQPEHRALLDLGDVGEHQRLAEQDGVGDDDDGVAEEDQPAAAARPELAEQPVDGHVAAGLRRQRDAGDDEPGEEPLGQLLRRVEAAGREGVAGRDVGGEDQGEREAGHQHDEAAEAGDQPVDPVRGGDGALRHRRPGGRCDPRPSSRPLRRRREPRSRSRRRTRPCTSR